MDQDRLEPGYAAETGFGDSAPESDRLIDIRVLLHHLERFRWCFIKGLAAVLLATVFCLVAGNWIVLVLKWPLMKAAEQSTSEPSLYLATATNRMTRLPVPDQAAWKSVFGAQQQWRLQLRPVTHKNNVVLGFVAQPFQPGARTEVALNTYGPIDGFLVALEVALFGGLLLASPFVFYYVGQFILPLLGQGGAVVKRATAPWVMTALGLFLGGVVFCYFLLLPVSLYGSVGFSEWMHFQSDEWRAEAYIGFVCKFMLAMGLGFELPLIIILLAKVGFVDYLKLTKFRTYWIVLDLVVSAILTPDGSPITMLLMAAPLLILYEVSVWIVRGMEQKTRSVEAS